MKIAIVLEPLSDANLRLAKQIGVDEVVGRYPGSELDDLRPLKEHVKTSGLRLGVIEGYVPMDKIVLDEPGRDDQVELIEQLICNMGELDIPVLCYNFMSTGDMTRTNFGVEERGGALVNSFDAALLENDPPDKDAPVTEDQLWERLKRFLEEILPAAEAAGVKLAMHPDDPPIPEMHGIARIMGSIENYERLVGLVPSESNGICFCQGCFSEMGEDVPAAIRKLGAHIHYAHFRDVKGCATGFQETFHDCGQTDMAEAIRAYHEIGFDGPIRPDHVPRLEGETGAATGYTIKGRLFAVGYMRGLMHAVETEK